MKPVIIIGAGGHTKVLIDVLRLKSINIVGILEADKHKVGAFFCKVPILGFDDEIKCYDPNDILLVNGLGSVGLPIKRQIIFDTFKNKKFNFATVIHPSAIIAQDVVVEEGCQIMAGVIVQAGSRIGYNSILNTGVIVEHDCVIGNHVHLAPGAVLSGGILIDDTTHIGIGAKIIQNIKIGNHVVIGAGSVIIKNVPNDVVIAGVPGKVVRLNSKGN